MTNVVNISRAKSFVAPTEDRWVDIYVLMHHFSISYAAAKNYAHGYYWRKGEKVPYPNGAMPHMKTPGGHLRFNLAQCQDWFQSEQNPV